MPSPVAVSTFRWENEAFTFVHSQHLGLNVISLPRNTKSRHKQCSECALRSSVRYEIFCGRYAKEIAKAAQIISMRSKTLLWNLCDMHTEQNFKNGISLPSNSLLKIGRQMRLCFQSFLKKKTTKFAFVCKSVRFANAERSRVQEWSGRQRENTGLTVEFQWQQWIFIWRGATSVWQMMLLSMLAKQRKILVELCVTVHPVKLYR